MRKFLAVLLAASVLTPGVAWADNHRERSDRARERGDVDGQRAERRAERPQRAERQRPAEAVAPRTVEARRDNRDHSSDNGVRWIGRREQRQVEQRQAEQRVVEQAPVQQVERRRERAVRNRDGSFLGGVIDTAQVQRDGIRTRDGDRRDGNWRDGRGDWQSNDRNRDRSDWRDRDRDRSSRWTSQWRSDRRYDWRNHRERNRSVFRVGRYYDPYGYGYRRFSIGFSLFPNYYQSNYWLDDPWQYRLPPAYGPYRWVRYYDDALLVNVYSGEVVDAIHGFFW